MANLHDRQFTSDEVSAIVRRALTDSGGSDTITYEELEDIARKSGIAPGRLESAIRLEESEGALERARDQWVRQRREQFFDHFRCYLIVNGVLVAMNFLTGGYPWAMWPILGWGIGLLFDGSEAFYPKRSTIDRGAQKILRKQRKNRERARRYESEAYEFSE